MRKIIISCASLFICVVVQAQNTISPAGLMSGRGVDFAAAEIRIETVAPGLHVLFGIGGNVAASIGDQGVLAVDDQFPAMVPKIRAAIRELGGGEVELQGTVFNPFERLFFTPSTNIYL